MNIKKVILGCLLLALSLEGWSETVIRYRVYLKDKAKTTFTLENPASYLSDRSLQRRAKQSLPITYSDLPVSQAYVNTLQKQGVRIVTQSKWNNTVVVETTDTVHMQQTLEQLPFVNKVKKVWTKPDFVPERNKNRKKEVTNHFTKTDNPYGKAYPQIAMHHGDSLHAAGFRGKGMHIAVIDAGYYNADVIKLFKKVDVLGMHNFVHDEADLFEEQSHGMKVLSCMAVNRPQVMVGTAPEASYWLLRSEDDDTEQPIEEDYWAAAIEFADSAGVDVVNTSLGYYAFDDSLSNYRYRDLDGHTSLMSNSASMAADKGMLVVCSAGNSGMSSWKKVTPPGDAENVLTVGAISKKRVNADFSSVGNTTDGRIKPDVMAVGFESVVVDTNGAIGLANGTSFSSPTFCGLVACLWQACPWLTAKEMIELIRRSADRFDYPDNIFGYGIPDVWKAYQDANEKKHK